jgi:hypothetical protein
MAWRLTHGDPGDAFLCHRCDNPPCCNPAHLFLGTQIDNMRDSVLKNRAGMAQLSTSDVEELLRQWHAGASRAELSERFSISYAHACKIIKRRAWSVLEHPGTG